MQVFPIISTVNGRTITGTTTEPNADRLASAINRKYQDGDVVRVGEPFVLNPAWSKDRAPGALDQMLAAALVPSEQPELVG